MCDTDSAMLKVAVLVLDEVFDLGLATVCDTLAIANALAPTVAAASGRGRKKPPFEVTRIGLRKKVQTAQGLLVPVASAKRETPDLVIVPALGAKTREALSASLLRSDVADAGELLLQWRAAGTRVTGACTATFVLAQAGLLDGQCATTTWWLAPLFRERFPAVALDDSRMVVEAPGAVTAGAALAHLDLALWVVRRSSPQLARAAAHHLLFDEHASQAGYVIPDYVAHADPLVERFEAWARTHLTTFSVPAAAKAVGASERSLVRHVQAVLGKSPLAYVQDLRVEEAVHQLETTDLNIDAIAERVGYQNSVTLRALLKKKTGRGAREHRRARTLAI